VNLLAFFVAETLTFESRSAGEDDRLDVKLEFVVLLRSHGNLSDAFGDFGVSNSCARFSPHFCGWVFFLLRSKVVVIMVVEWKISLKRQKDRREGGLLRDEDLNTV